MCRFGANGQDVLLREPAALHRRRSRDLVMRDIRERKFLELREDAVGRGPDRFGPALLRCLDRCGDRAIGAVAAAARRDLRSAEHN